MLEIRHISDEEVDQQVALTPLHSMSTLFIDDVLAVVERGSRRLPSYLDLYRKAVSQAWSPYELDFSQDREEWQQLAADTKKRRTWSLRMFFAGEERVASLLAPLVWAAPSKDVEAFVATQLADEVRHTILFDRYWREVVGTDAEDLHGLVQRISVTARENPAYRYLFYEWLPEQSQWMASHPSDVEATVKFVTVYHLIVEGALFLTGMRYQLEGARRWGRTWGFYQGFTAATRDESRHVLFGVRYLRDRVTENPRRFVPLVQDTIREFRPLIPTIMRPPGGDMNFFGGKHLESAWSGLSPEQLRNEMVDYALSALGRRLHAVGISH
ncbi:MAG TPA: ribonucleotide-diphosphate reductase subunit beta [Terriglobales bacterium]|jgi:ribonucleoside-diphosphate reductase beta chain|nr:ribonucleotide-diphosphate reductase subunit beta [Terriglobales bacterium]